MASNVCDATQVTCLPIPPINWASRSGYLFVAPISSYLSLLLIIGYFRFKSLRDRPGDLILGLSVSNFILCIYWTLSMVIPDLNIGCGCYVTGIIATFSGFANYVYNLGFVFYLQQKLQNLLTQARIIRAWFIHFVCLVASGCFLGYLVWQNSIGQNLFGTCSKIFTCDQSIFTGSAVVVFYLIYEIFSVRLYYYMKTSFGEASSTGIGAEQFVANYRHYLLVTTVLWLIVATGIAYSEFTTDSNSTLTVIIISVSNVVGVLQSVVLTIYRYRDPLVGKSMSRLIFFWRKRSDEKPGESVVHKSRYMSSSLISNSIGGDLQRPLVDSLLSVASLDSSSQANLVERFSKKRKLDLTYSVLSSVIMAYMNSGSVSESHPDLAGEFDQVATHDLYEELVFHTITNARKEFKTAKCHMISAKLHMMAPEVFKRFIAKDFGMKQVLKSLDLHVNRKKIKEENKGDGGKSGEFFFFSSDNQVLIKSISDEEWYSLLRVLRKYHEHMEKNPDSLLTKIYGIFQIEWQYKPLNLIVMRSVCPYPKKYIERTYDMKGSTYDRKSLKEKQYADTKILKSKTLKDFDFLRLEQNIKITEELKFKIMDSLKEDLDFLWKAELIDYSLVLFVVNKEKYTADMKKLLVTVPETNAQGAWLYSLPIEGEPSLCYCLGIIDFLQTYTLKKKMEKNAKKLLKLDPSLDTSAQDPTVYKERFKRFMASILSINTSLKGDSLIQSGGSGGSGGFVKYGLKASSLLQSETTTI